MNKSISKVLSVILTSTSILTANSNIPASCITCEKTYNIIKQKVHDFLSSVTLDKALNTLGTTILCGASLYTIYGAVKSYKMKKSKQQSIENIKNLGSYTLKIHTGRMKKKALNDVFKNSIKNYFCDNNRILLCGVPNNIKYTMIILGMSGDDVIVRKFFLNAESEQENKTHTISLDEFAAQYLDICSKIGVPEIDIIGSSEKLVYIEYCADKNNEKIG